MWMWIPCETPSPSTDASQRGGLVARSGARANICVRHRNHPALCFPMNIVCSEELAKLCSLNDIVSPGVIDTEQVTCSVPPGPSRPTGPAAGSLVSLLGNLESLQIDDSMSRRAAELNRNSEEDSEDDCDRFQFSDHSFGRSISDEDSPKDFTACGGDDCSWCGHCDY